MPSSRVHGLTLFLQWRQVHDPNPPAQDDPEVSGKVRQLARYVAADALGPTRHAPADPRDVELEVKVSILFNTRHRAHLPAG
jgi:hypothetical protein